MLARLCCYNVRFGMGTGWRNLGRRFLAAVILFAALAVFFYARADAGLCAEGDAIEIGRPKSESPTVKQGQLAPEDGGDESGGTGGGDDSRGDAPTHPDTEGDNEGEDVGDAEPPLPNLEGDGEIAPKDVLPGLPAPGLPVGKEGAPVAAEGEDGEWQEGDRKEPEFPIEENYLRFKSADSVSYDKNAKLLKLTGDVVIEVEDVTLTADYIEVNNKSSEIYAKGHVAIWQEDDIIFGDELYMNYGTKYFRITNPSGNSSGKDINGRVYFEGKNLEGTFDRYVITKGRITTCEPFCAIDEYHIKSKKIIVRPKKRIVMEHNYSYIREKKVFYWPLIVIPLEKQEGERNRGPFEQNYGRNPTEGYFAKYAWTYRVRHKSALQDPLIGVALLEFMENKGLNVGQRQDFYFTDLGVTSLKWEYLFSNESTSDKTTAALMSGTGWTNPSDQYRLPSQDDEEGKKPKDFYYKITQDLRFTPSISGSMSVERTNKYNLFRSRTNTFRSSFNLKTRSDDWQTSVNMNSNWTASSSSTGTETKNINTSGGFSSNLKMSNDLSWNLSQSYSAIKRSDGGPADQEGTFKSIFKYTRPKYNLDFTWQEMIDFDDETYLGDRTTNVTHYTPKAQFTLKKSIWDSRIPELSNISISLSNTQSGRRKELESLVHFNLKTRLSKNFQINRKSSLSTSVDFKQDIYDDGNAVYEYSPRVEYKYNPRTWWDLSLSWNKRQPEGRASPSVERGYRSSSNNFSGRMNFTNNKTWKGSFNTSLDYKNSKWKPLNFRWSWDPNDNFGMSVDTVWETEYRTFRNTRISTSYYADSGKWNLFTRSDIGMSRMAKDRQLDDGGGSMRHKEHLLTLEKVTLVYNRVFTRNWDLQLLSEYKRGSKGFKVLRRVALTKVNCCTTIQFGYDAGRKEYTLQVFINAFPKRTVTVTGRSEKEAEGESMQFFLDTPANDLFNPGTYRGGGIGAFY